MNKWMDRKCFVWGMFVFCLNFILWYVQLLNLSLYFLHVTHYFGYVFFFSFHSIVWINAPVWGNLFCLDVLRRNYTHSVTELYDFGEVEPPAHSGHLSIKKVCYLFIIHLLRNNSSSSFLFIPSLLVVLLPALYVMLALHPIIYQLSCVTRLQEIFSRPSESTVGTPVLCCAKPKQTDIERDTVTSSDWIHTSEIQRYAKLSTESTRKS